MKRNLAKLVADGFYREALYLYSQHHSTSPIPLSFTFPSLLKACAKLSLPSQGQMLHTHVIKTGFHADIYVSTALTNLYMKVHYLNDALNVFDDVPERNVASFNAIISGCSENGYCSKALQVFRQTGLEKFRPNSVTIASLLPACDTVNQCTQLHCWAVKLGVEADIYVATSLVTMYSNCEELVSATKMFERLHKKNVVSYNAFISGLLQNGFPQLVVNVFKNMRECSDYEPNSVTLISVLSVCASLLYVRFGRQVHGFIKKVEMEPDVKVGTALVDMYSKCGCWQWACDAFKELKGSRNLITWNSMIAGMMLNARSESAIQLFQELELEGLKPDSATWNSMISGFSQLGKGTEAFKYFKNMQSAGVDPSLKTITSLLPACSDLSALQCGEEIHGHALRTDISADEFIATALIDMYMKCGHPSWARRIFDQFVLKPGDPAFWNAMISGYGRNGEYESAFEIFDQMREEMVLPNSATFVSVLSACSHAGQVDKGLQVLRIMKIDHGLQPKAEHFGCVVDLLGRFGRLAEARNLVQELVEPSASIFASLLGACKAHLDPDLGEEMALMLLDLEPKNPAPLADLSNIYATVGSWGDVERIREMMNDKGLGKLPGFSSIRAI
ncbi:Pentatricopeptide repeat-containing protein [Quillaja saponaria]|uniref:Pentatricopeptide repeat-containing protein n=1 Tax=Quillaja saponaria TaxID=32244 RepID=A0AAD7L9L5_QUISA|nr:Pentatricopeptide repeat-containing protein [Quillaja saponaria]